MKTLILRLDDACERMDVNKWSRMEALLDKYSIRPLVGVIPHCEDSKMSIYNYDDSFWEKVSSWIDKGWEIALHGYNHVYLTESGGINPVNKRSEFAGIPLEEQREKIRRGISIFKSHGIDPHVFFAPSHTFDSNTLTAIKEESGISIISDTIAFDSYSKYGFTFVPQQSGVVRKLPFKTITFCYHPNSMKDNDFVRLEDFLKANHFSPFPLKTSKRKFNFFDRILRYFYMKKHK